MAGFDRRPLGRTGLDVSPLGIGGGSQITSTDLLHAFDLGVNYFFYSSDMHHFAYQKSAAALRQLCGSGSSVRDKVVLATVSYVNDPEKILGVLYDQFTELGVDYIDVFHWGWITDRTDSDSLLEVAAEIKGGGLVCERLRHLLGLHAVALEVSDEIRRRGLVRHVGASFHSRRAAAARVDSVLDVLMLRYNISHPGVELDVFPLLTGDKHRDPGIVAFNVAHEGLRFFNVPPPGYPDGYAVPAIPDCYRFVLSNPAVDVVLAGVQNRTELHEALAALERGPMSATEQRFMRNYGAVHANRARVRAPGATPAAPVPG